MNTNSPLFIGGLVIAVFALLGFWIWASLRVRRLARILAVKDADIHSAKQEAASAIAAANANSAEEIAYARSDAAQRIADANARAISASETAKEQIAAALRHYEGEMKRGYEQNRAWLVETQRSVEQERSGLVRESLRIKEHYEAEYLKLRSETQQALDRAQAELTTLARYKGLRDAETETREVLEKSLAAARALRADAEALLQTAERSSKEERALASRKAAELKAQADQLLDRATRQAAGIVDDAHRRAQQIAGDAYTALREKESLEQAIRAARNVLEGYGDRYVVPTHSVIDDLAADFGHTEAGKNLGAAREQSKRMVEERVAAGCEYVDSDRCATAIRFIVDAFNGKVDAILSEEGLENYGTLAQRIRDAFDLVNVNGQAFRNARILPAYLDSRLNELKWAVATDELRKKEREEQRRIKEQIREEEKARREYERAIREARDEEEKIQRAIARAKAEADAANSQDRARLEQEIAALNQRLTEAEEKNQRAISMAQQTKKGNVYVISNLGSFGEEIFKIGMTRRLEPLDRIWELSDASVPFDFDVHAMIPSDDAPALESALHAELEDLRINKVNYRKEFFKVGLERVREVIARRGIEASFTMLAEAHEYRETQKLNQMTPEARKRYWEAAQPILAAAGVTSLGE